VLEKQQDGKNKNVPRGTSKRLEFLREMNVLDTLYFIDSKIRKSLKKADEKCVLKKILRN